MPVTRVLCGGTGHRYPHGDRSGLLVWHAQDHSTVARHYRCQHVLRVLRPDRRLGEGGMGLRYMHTPLSSVRSIMLLSKARLKNSVMILIYCYVTL